MALGPELVTNGDFSNGETGWQMAGDTFISESGWCEFYSNGDYLRQNPGISLNKTYQVRVDIGGDVGSGTFKLYCYIENDSYIIQSGGSQEFNLTPTEVSPTAKLEFVFDTTGFTGELIELDNISVREKLGGLSAPAKTFFGENEQ